MGKVLSQSKRRDMRYRPPPTAGTGRAIAMPLSCGLLFLAASTKSSGLGTSNLKQATLLLEGLRLNKAPAAQSYGSAMGAVRTCAAAQASPCAGFAVRCDRHQAAGDVDSWAACTCRVQVGQAAGQSV